MISQACKYILFISFLILASALKFIALAEEAAAEGVIARPVMVYESTESRDPFKAYLRKEKPAPVVEQKAGDVIKPEIDVSKLKVQGIIWGVKVPQAIINDQVLKVGDLIEEAKILSIEKEGITLSFQGEIFDLTVPGQDSAQAEIK